MLRLKPPLLLLASALCLIAEGAALLVASRWSRAPHVPWSLAWAALALVTLLLVLLRWRRSTSRRAGWLAVATGQLVGLVAIGFVLGFARANPERWLAGQRAALSEAVQQQEQSLARLTLAWRDVCELAARDASRQEPFALLTELHDQWRARAGSASWFPLALTLWKEEERIGWDAGVVPLPLPEEAAARTTGWSLLQRGRQCWYWRHFYPLPLAAEARGILEMQIQLDADDVPTQASYPLVTSGASPAYNGPSVARRVVLQRTASRSGWSGDAEHGLRLARNLDLAAATRDGQPAWLSVQVQSLPWRWHVQHTAAAQLLVLLLSWSLSALGLAGAAAGIWGLVIGAWCVRGMLVGVDLFRWLQAALPGQQLPASPGKAASLLDPAYFATPFAGGTLASTADAVLTALLLGLTARLLIGRLRTRQTAASAPAPAGPPPAELPRTGARAQARGPAPAGTWLRLVGSLLIGLVLALLLLGLRSLAFEVVQNANPRLIGPRVPLRFVSFWALHLVLLLFTSSALGLSAALMSRGRRWLRGHGSVIPLVVGAAIPPLLVAGLSPVTFGTVVIVALLSWGMARRRAPREFPLRDLTRMAPVLLAVVWNYVVLAEAYGRAESAWLQRKGDAIVQAQDDWIRFLMEDVLTEMAASEPAPVPPDNYAPEAEDLWRNLAAYELWQGSAVHDLGLSCLVEILDEDGYTESLFASGFFQDFGYEVQSCSDWSLARPEGGALPAPVSVQTEVRRYPTGQERILRGEVPRHLKPGWLRLELPVQSSRIVTLMSQLTGLGPEPQPRGYQPRAEVDRPLLLLRGGTAGWQDVGSASFPDSASAPAVRQLQSGARAWGTVKDAGVRYHCLWRAIQNPEGEATGEGFLLGIQIPTVIDRLLDLSRLLLLDLLLFACLATLALPWRLAHGGRPRLSLGFQERFTAGYLVLGILLLLLAGLFIDRLTLDRLVREARSQSRAGLTAALAQLQGLLSEQARALAESDYIADLLANRLAGGRPLGPFSARQGMVFAGSGQLLLDETLSDLDDQEAALLLQTARASPLLVMDDGTDLYFGTTIPIDLSGVLPDTTTAGGEASNHTASGSGAAAEGRRRDGTFFYRQRASGDLLAGLADIVQGEITLRVEGQTVLASHPERVFSALTPLMVPPAMMRQLLAHVANPTLYPRPGTRLSYTSCIALPTLALGGPQPGLQTELTPAVLAVQFPARERDFVTQREQTILFLAGLASLFFLTAALLAMLLTWNIFGPVRMLVTATRHLAAGDYAAPLPAAGSDEVGTLAASFAAMRDGLQEAQVALAERERFLATVLRRVPVGVVVYATGDRVVALNPAAEAILTLFFGQPPGDSEPLAQRLLAGFRSVIGSATQGEGELHSRDGRFTLHGRMAPLELSGGQRDMMIVFEDVTEFLDNKRLALNAELARQVAHEIKNPLTPIQLSVQLLRQAYLDRSPRLDQIMEETVRQVLEQVSLLRAIATEFSLLGRPGELECAPVDLPALVRKVIAGYQLAGEGAVTGRVQARIAEVTAPPVLAHADSLVKVLANLMQNSLDACGGPESLQLDIAWELPEGHLTLLWGDNGPGVPAEVADRLFDPYFSTKSKGTGLGLAICRNLLDKMGGSITLTNRLDGPGAIAAVTLPVADADSRSAGSPR